MASQECARSIARGTRAGIVPTAGILRRRTRGNEMGEHHTDLVDPAERQRMFEGLIRIAAVVIAVVVVILVFLAFVGT